MEGVNLRSVFKGRKVMITGDTGFKGSWLSLWLHELGADILGYSLPPKQDKDLFNILKLGKIIRHIDGDIRNYAFLKKAADDFRPEFIFHLAAQAIVKTSYLDPKLTFDTNIMGSVNILEVIRNSDYLRSAIYVTSDKCYRNKEWLWGYRENDELGGYDPYSASKAAAEIVLSAYRDSFFKNNKRLGVSSVRAGNVIGGGDWSVERIVPDCIRSLMQRNPILIRNLNAVRPWQHVLEPLYGYLILSAKLFKKPNAYSGAYNFGPQRQAIKTVGELAKKVMTYWGSGAIKSRRNSGSFHESSMLHLNCDKAHQALRWRQKWDFDKTIYETVQWYKQVLAGKPAISITKRQIHDYMEESHD